MFFVETSGYPMWDNTLLTLRTLVQLRATKRKQNYPYDGGVYGETVPVCKCPVLAICLTSRLEIFRLSPGAYVKSAVY